MERFADVGTILTQYYNIATLSVHKIKDLPAFPERSLTQQPAS